MNLTNTLEVPSHIFTGIADGRFELFGGTVRMASGEPGAGQIVALLRDGATSEASTLLTAALPGIAAAASAATLGVSAVSFALLSAKLKRIERDLKLVHEVVRNVASDIDAIIVANLRTACDLLRKAERAECPEKSDFLLRSIERFLEASNTYQERLASTADSDRDLLDQYFKALALSCAGELACHYMRGDWNELLAAANTAAELIRPIQHRIVSLALVNHPDFLACMNAKQEDSPLNEKPSILSLPDSDRSSTTDELAAPGSLAGNIAFCTMYMRIDASRVRFRDIYLMAQTLEPNLTETSFIDLLRPIPQTLKSPFGISALKKIKMQRLLELKPKRLFGVDYEEDMPAAFAAIAERGLAAVLIGNAVRSYSPQYQALCEADLPRPKLLELFANTDIGEEAYLVNLDYLNAA